MGTELEKQNKTHGERIVLEAFLEWLNSKDIQLAKWGEVNGVDRLFLIETRHQELLNKYFSINAKKLEERRELLENL